MTTIVFRDGILASDSSAVTGMTLTYITFEQKIKTSSCKRFAWGFSGSVIDPDYLKELELLLFANLIAVQTTNARKVKFSPELVALVDGRDFIIMTHDSVYSRWKDDDDKTSLCKMVLGEFVAVGTGRIVATAAFLAGKDAKEAVEFAQLHDFYTYPGKVLQIKQSSLKPLPKEIKNV